VLLKKGPEEEKTGGVKGIGRSLSDDVTSFKEGGFCKTGRTIYIRVRAKEKVLATR